MMNEITHFTHPNGTVESVPPKREDVGEITDAHENETRSVDINRLAYKVEDQTDWYKYKYHQLEEDE
jgi:hypothetical protein